MSRNILVLISLILLTTLASAQKKQVNQLSYKAIQELNRVIDYEWNNADNRDAFRAILFENMRMVGVRDLESALEAIQSITTSKKSRDLILFALKNSAGRYRIPVPELLKSWGMGNNYAYEIDYYINILIQQNSSNEQAKEPLSEPMSNPGNITRHLNAVESVSQKKNTLVNIDFWDPSSTGENQPSDSIGSFSIIDLKSNKLLKKYILKFESMSENPSGVVYTYKLSHMPNITGELILNMDNSPDTLDKKPYTYLFLLSIHTTNPTAYKSSLFYANDMQ